MESVPLTLPLSGVVVFVDHSRGHSGRQDLERHEKRDDRVAVARAESLEGQPRHRRFAVVGHHCISNEGVPAVMEVRRRVREAPDAIRARPQRSRPARAWRHCGDGCALDRKL
jgi:hypothetical protein